MYFSFSMVTIRTICPLRLSAPGSSAPDHTYIARKKPLFTPLATAWLTRPPVGYT